MSFKLRRYLCASDWSHKIKRSKSSQFWEPFLTAASELRLLLSLLRCRASGRQARLRADAV